MIDDIDLDGKAQEKARKVSKLITGLGKPFGPYEAFVVGYKEGNKDAQVKIKELENDIEKLKKVLSSKEKK